MGPPVRTLLRDPRIAVAEGALSRVASGPSRLFPEERRLVSAAVPKRQREFIAGRALARRALEQLGFARVPVEADSAGAPIWPEGIVGSISHSDTYCAVAVGRRRDFAGIGIDVERKAPLEPHLWTYILRDRERRELTALRERDRGVRAMAIFSAKEALYKAQYPLTGAFVDYLEAEIQSVPGQGRFRAHFVAGPAAELFGELEVTGEVVVADDVIASAVALTASSLPGR